MNPENLIKDIIKEQSLIIGEPLAFTQAMASGAVNINPQNMEVKVTVDPKQAIKMIVESYKAIFGQTSVEVCIKVIQKYPKDSVQHLIPDELMKTK